MKCTRIILIFKNRINKLRFEGIFESIAKRLGFDAYGGEDFEGYCKDVIANKTRPSIGICYRTKTITLVLPNRLPKDEDEMYKYQYVDVEC